MTFQEAWKNAGETDLLGTEWYKGTKDEWRNPKNLTAAGLIDQFLRNDWDVLKHTPPMDFATAMKHVSDGRGVRRRIWKDDVVRKGTYLELRSDILKATDWEVVD